MNKRPRLLIADDHVMVGESLGLLLARWFDVIAVIDQLGQIVPTAERLLPDAALLDYSFGPAGNCMPLIGPLLEAAPACRVVVLTAHDSPALADTAIAAGASAFVSKTASPDELRLAIAEALRDERGAEPGRRRSAPGHINTAAGDTAAEGPFGIRQREAAILLMMYSGMKQAEIATELGVATKTVEYYRYLVAKKIGITKLSLLLRWVAENRDVLERTAGTTNSTGSVSPP